VVRNPPTAPARKTLAVIVKDCTTHNKLIKMKEKVEEIIDGFTIKYHANGKTIWSKGKIANGKPVGYWEWYRIEGTIKRSGHFNNGEPVDEWITYDSNGKPYKTTNK
jgi:antitoxin component YwqK of YwqJK toxin-antitoxin module